MHGCGTCETTEDCSDDEVCGIRGCGEPEQLLHDCRNETCSVRALDEAFDIAISELAREEDIDGEDLWSDPRFFADLVFRMRGVIERVADVDFSHSSSALRVTPATNRDPDVVYCGLGEMDAKGPLWRGNYPGTCLNNVCFRHDQCYSKIGNQSKLGCYWGNTTAYCDRTFFDEANDCDCEWAGDRACVIVQRVAARLHGLCGGLLGRELLPLACTARDACPSCEPKGCEELDACGKLRDGCGGISRCEGCAEALFCGEGLTANQCLPCKPTEHTMCLDNEVYERDNCRNPTRLEQRCQFGEECFNFSSGEYADCRTCSQGPDPFCRGQQIHERDCAGSERLRETCPTGSVCWVETDNAQCCALQAERRCDRTGHGGDVYWYDSCGRQGEVAEACPMGARCEDASCMCQPTWRKTCFEGNAWSTNTCGERVMMTDDCPEDVDCLDGDCCRIDANPRRICHNGSVYTTDRCDRRIDRVERCPSSRPCNSGRCGVGCTSHSERRCYMEDLYWYDSCGAREDRSEICMVSNIVGTRCRNGACCVSHATRQCDRNRVLWFDSCGNGQDVIETCSSSQVCQNAMCVTATPCSTTQRAGSDAPESHTINLGRNSGSFSFSWNTYTIPDRIIVRYGGATLYDTGCVGTSGQRSISFSGSSSAVTVSVQPNCSMSASGTQWEFTAGCP